MNKFITILTAVVMTVVLTAAFVPTANARGMGIPNRHVTVLTPNGGEVWKIGTVQRIKWEAVELGGPFLVQVMGKGHSQIVAKIDGMDYYDWRVTGPVSPLTLVRVFTLDPGGMYSDTSDMPFSIVN